MVQKILNAVTKAIDTEFGYERIFTDEVVQGVELPYAFVTIDPSPRVKLAGDRYSETSTVSVIVEIPSSPTMFDDLRAIGERLENVLEYITLSNDEEEVGRGELDSSSSADSNGVGFANTSVSGGSGDILRGENFYKVIQDGYIDFTADYSYFLRKIKDTEETMQSVVTTVTIND